MNDKGQTKQHCHGPRGLTSQSTQLCYFTANHLDVESVSSFKSHCKSIQLTSQEQLVTVVVKHFTKTHSSQR